MLQDGQGMFGLYHRRGRRGCSTWSAIAHVLPQPRGQLDVTPSANVVPSASVQKRLRRIWRFFTSDLFVKTRRLPELTAQIQMHEAVAQAREEFNARMLAKDVELVHLQAQLKLADERTVLNQKLAAAVAENVQIQASLRVAQCQTETLKHQIAQRSHDVTAALADSHANNAKLTQRIVELEKQLEMLNVRLAEKPTDKQVQ